MTDPTQVWRESMSIRCREVTNSWDTASASAQLRQTQQALAASQTDLTRVEGELHDALRRAADLEQVRADLAEAKALTDIFVQDNQRLEAERAERVDASFALRDERDEARAEAKQWRAQAELHLAQRDDALHDLAHARFQLTATKARLDSLRETFELVKNHPMNVDPTEEKP